jgi:hypothetical protein
MQINDGNAAPQMHGAAAESVLGNRVEFEGLVGLVAPNWALAG